MATDCSAHVTGEVEQQDMFSQRVVRRLSLGLAIVLVIGCGAASPFSGAVSVSSIDMPFSRQKGLGCGVAAVKNVLDYYGKPLTQEQIREAIGLGQPGGGDQEWLTTLPRMLSFIRSQGLRCELTLGDLELLAALVEARAPTILFVRSKGSGLIHAVNCVGYDERRRQVLIHTGQQPSVREDAEHFMRRWAEAGFAMLVCEPSDLAEGRGKSPWDAIKVTALRFSGLSVEERNALGVFFEQRGRFEAALQCFLSAYEAEQSGLVATNVANAYRNLGASKVAENWYRRAMALSPSYPISYFNLADLCLARGRPDEVLEIVDAALQSCDVTAELKQRFAALRARAEQGRGTSGELSSGSGGGLSVDGGRQ